MASAQNLVPGKATTQGTKRFAARQRDISPAHYRTSEELALSDLGIGTYLGEHDEATDRRYTESVIRAIERGVNVIDTAINYRSQRSERSIGAALQALMKEKKIERDEIFVATKGGFVSFDGSPTKSPMEYLQKTFFDPGICTPEDVVAGVHCMHPGYLRHELEASRKNLGLQTLDLYYLHNVETQLDEIDRSDFEKRLREAFEMLEGAVGEGKIERYGLATWEMFRVADSARNYFALERAMEIAREIGGERHHFRAVQLPFNLAYRDAAVSATQTLKGESVSFLRAAEELGILVMASIPLFQGRLLGKLPSSLQAHFPQAATDAQRAIAFAAAAPGMISALAGMSRVNHVDENTEYLRQKPMDAAAWRTIVDNIV